MTPQDMLAKLISFNTVSRDSNLALIEFVQNYLADYGIDTHLVHNQTGNKANLYATIGPQCPGGVVLSGHTDVVPVDGQPWNTDPFTLVQQADKLYGRGTSDMKSFIAIALALVPSMTQLKKPIHLAWSYDEEVGCQGAPAMIEALVKHLPAPEAVIVGEPTSMKVVNSHKGIADIITRVRGYPAHSSQILHRGVSAVMVAARLINFIEQLMLQQRDNALPAAGFTPAHTTTHVGTINGGTAVNITAQDCEFQWDIRCIPGQDPQLILQKFEAYCQETIVPEMRKISSETWINTEVIANVPPLQALPENQAVYLAQALLEDSEVQQVSYTTEGGQFQTAGFHVVICGPGSINQAHQPNEFITVEQLTAGTQFIQRLIQRLSA